MTFEPTVSDGWRGPLPDLLKYVRLTWGGDAQRGGDRKGRGGRLSMGYRDGLKSGPQVL